MSANTMFSYQRLRTNGEDQEEEGREIGKTKRWFRIRRFAYKNRRKTNVRLPALNKFLKRKNKLLNKVRVSWAKVMKRFKDTSSTAHLGDMFAGNYLFLQVNPSSLKCVDKSYIGYQLHGLPPRHTLTRIA